MRCRLGAAGGTRRCLLVLAALLLLTATTKTLGVRASPEDWDPLVASVFGSATDEGSGEEGPLLQHPQQQQQQQEQRPERRAMLEMAAQEEGAEEEDPLLAIFATPHSAAAAEVLRRAQQEGSDGSSSGGQEQQQQEGGSGRVAQQQQRVDGGRGRQEQQQQQQQQVGVDEALSSKHLDPATAASLLDPEMAASLERAKQRALASRAGRGQPAGPPGGGGEGGEQAQREAPRQAPGRPGDRRPMDLPKWRQQPQAQSGEGTGGEREQDQASAGEGGERRAPLQRRQPEEQKEGGGSGGERVDPLDAAVFATGDRVPWAGDSGRGQEQQAAAGQSKGRPKLRRRDEAEGEAEGGVGDAREAAVFQTSRQTGAARAVAEPGQGGAGEPGRMPARQLFGDDSVHLGSGDEGTKIDPLDAARIETDFEESVRAAKRAQQAQQLAEQQRQRRGRGDAGAQPRQQQLQQQQQQAAQQGGPHATRRPLPDAFAQAQLAQQAARRREAVPGGQAPQRRQQLQREQQWGEGGEGAVAAGTLPLHQRIPLVDVAVMTVMMAAAAGIGALPFFFMKELSTRMAGLATAVACGVMFACSFDLVHSGQPYGPQLVVLGVVLGGLFIRASQQWLEAVDDIKFENLQGAGARKTLLLVGVMAAHALGEGCGVGVSFVGDRGWSQGVLTTLAIGIHNIPEGLAKATVLVGQGVSARSALFWSVLTCLPQPLVAVPSFLFVEAFRAILPVALGFAGGCMIWIVFAELLPDAFASAPPKQVASAATLAAAGLEGVRMFFESLEVQGYLSVPNPFPGDLSLLLPALGVMLPAVAAAALAGGLLTNLGLPSPVNYGLASALLGTLGAVPLLQALLPAAARTAGRALGQHSAHGAAGTLHLVAGAASGALLTLLLRHQLLQLLRRRSALGLGRTSSGAARSFLDLEAADKKGSGADLPQGGTGGSSAHLFAAAYPLLHAGPAGTVGGSLLGNPALLPPRAPANGHRGSTNGSSKEAAAVEDAVANFLGSWGLAFLAGERGSARGVKLAAPQYAAALTACLVLAANAVPQGWHIAGGMLAIAPDMSTLLLPAALALLLLGATAGALAAAVSAPSPTRGAAAGGLLAGGVTLFGMLALARYDAAAAVPRFDPHLLTLRLQAVTGGALCMAAFILFGVGYSLHARRARGGFFLGALLAGAAYGFAGALCMLTPYCLDPPGLAR